MTIMANHATSQLHRLTTLALAVSIAILGISNARSAEKRSTPNIVFILADDLGYGDLGCYGCRDIKTPHIDRLAKQGVRFTNFYANGPECSPTRAALLTGRYQQRVGGLECAIGVGNVGRYDDAIRLRKTNDLGLPADGTTLPQLLKDAGYATGISGKWHLGYEDKFAPTRHGFEHAFYCLGGGMDYFHHVEEPPALLPVLRQDGKPVRRQGYFTDLVAEDAVQFMRANKDKPFFLYVPFTAPHAPFQGPNDRQAAPLKADSPLWKQAKAPPEVYAAMVESLDAGVGQIVRELEQLKLDENTLLIFTSDNGGTQSARATPLRGFKGSTFEGGIRVPCIIRWPGVLKANTVTDQPALTMDLSASVARVAGTKAPRERPFDGVDIVESISKGQPPPKRPLFWRGRRAERTWSAVRAGELKYVRFRDGTKVTEYLFDLHDDPGEKTDLLAARQEDAARLKQLLADWEKTVKPRR
jgi:N-acetylgalactosamine-6-sulfatase